jgi:beta-ring hydroxylase
MSSCARSIYYNNFGLNDCTQNDLLHKRRRRQKRSAVIIQRAAMQSNNDDDNKNNKTTNKLSLEERIASGEFTKNADANPLLSQIADTIKTNLLPKYKETGNPLVKSLILNLTKQSKRWKREADKQMPVASGDIREIAGQPVFVPLYKLFLAYGEQFVLAIGPKKFVVVSDNKVAKEILLHQAKSFSKGLLSEILDFVMGQGLIPANGDVWKIRRKIIVPALHRKYVASMVDMFGDCGLKGSAQLARAEIDGQSVEMENFYSRLALDIIGKAVFNYDFDSLKTDDPVIKAVYTVLREAEYRSVTFIPYWKVPPLQYLVPRQRACQEALVVVNDTLNVLINRCKKIVEEEDDEFVEEYMNKEDPSILHFLIASGDDVTSKQLRDDLMTLLIAGHETTAAVLTWTTFLLAKHPEVKQKVFDEVDRVCGDRLPTVADMRELKYTSRVINESMRLYPQPPVLIRRAIEPVKLGGYDIAEGTDFFISVWNLHRNPRLWDKPEEFIPERFPIDSKSPDEYTQDFAYLPFGGGQRKCIGDQFAIFESIVTLAMIMRRFDFELDPKFHPDGECGMTTGATIHTTTGLHVKLKRRDRNGGAEMTGEYSNTISEKSMPVYKSLDELEDIDVASGEVYAGVPPSDIATQKGDKLEEASASIAAAEQIAQAEKQRAKSPR